MDATSQALWKRRLVPLAVAGLLAACGGGGGGGGGARLCTYLSGGGTTAEFNFQCTCCTRANAERAIDGSLGTFAEMSFPGPDCGGTISLEATAQNGIVSPAGNFAGVVLAFAYQNSTSVSATITTYLDGVQQEQSNVGSIDGIGTASQDPPDVFGFVTAEPFDGVEYSFTRSGGTGGAEFEIYEVCSDT